MMSLSGFPSLAEWIPIQNQSFIDSLSLQTITVIDISLWYLIRFPWIRHCRRELQWRWTKSALFLKLPKIHDYLFGMLPTQWAKRRILYVWNTSFYTSKIRLILVLFVRLLNGRFRRLLDVLKHVLSTSIQFLIYTNKSWKYL